MAKVATTEPVGARREERARNLGVVSAAVEAEMVSAWARKTSFETRSAALVTANLAIVTLYFALLGNLGYKAVQRDGDPRLFAVFSLCAAVLAILAAVGCAIPLNYAGMKKGDFEKHLHTANVFTVDLEVEFIEARIDQLEAWTQSNRVKALLVLIAFCGTAAAVILFATSLITAAMSTS